jgi:HK97 family phage portal protein
VLVNVKEDGLTWYKMTVANPEDAKNNFFYEFSSEDIIHIHGYSRNGVYGLSVINTFKTLFDHYGELESAGTAIAKQAARPSSVITYPNNLKEDELAKLKSSWASGYSQGNSGKTAFIPATLKLEASTVGITAQEAEYIHQRQFSAARIAADIFRVPLHMLGLANAPTYASVDQMAQEFITYTISPILSNIEAKLNKALLGDDDEYYVKFNVQHLLRGDITKRVEYYKFALEHGIMSPNMVHRAEEDGIYVEADDGGDTFIRPVNYAAIDDSVTAKEETAEPTDDKKGAPVVPAPITPEE